MKELTESEKIASCMISLSISNIILQSREEKNIPPGSNPEPNRNIGFASVFLRLENQKEENVKVAIQSIEIRNLADGKVEMADSSPQEIILRPLENSELVFYLANKIGYSQHNQVKAVVIYQIGDRVRVIESSPVEVERI